MRKLTAAMAITALMTVAGTTNGVAQGGPTATGAASVTIPEVLVISSVGDLTIAEGEFDFSETNEASATGAVNISTRSNIVHAVDVTSTAIEQGGETLKFEVMNSAGTYEPATGTVKALAGLTRGVRSNIINFQATANVASHAPGEYTGTITYTVLATY